MRREKRTVLTFFLITLWLVIIILLLNGRTARGSDSQMYADIYDIDGQFQFSINIEKWDITRRVYNFDTSSFEGYTTKTMPSHGLFIFRDNSGEHRYSAYLKDVEQDGRYVRFKGMDARIWWDNEFILDYTQTQFNLIEQDELSLFNVIQKVKVGISESSNIARPAMQFANDVPNTIHTAFISNPIGSYKVVNGWRFLKPYLSYYGYRIDAKIVAKGDYGSTFSSIAAKHTILESVDNDVGIRLEDFIFKSSRSDIKVNHVIATIVDKQVNSSTTHNFTYSSLEIYENTTTALHTHWHLENYDPDWLPFNGTVYFADSSEDYDYDMKFKVMVWEGSAYASNNLTTQFLQIVDAWDARRDMAEAEFWLGYDNKIYTDSAITNENRIDLQRTKIFEAESLAEAQFQALLTLATSRYIENVMVTHIPNSPLDIKDLELYEFVDVYDVNGVMRTLPVSEIHWTTDKYEIKLGFKQTLLTEIIKED